MIQGLQSLMIKRQFLLLCFIFIFMETKGHKFKKNIDKKPNIKPTVISFSESDIGIPIQQHPMSSIITNPKTSSKSGSVKKRVKFSDEFLDETIGKEPLDSDISKPIVENSQNSLPSGSKSPRPNFELLLSLSLVLFLRIL